MHVDIASPDKEDIEKYVQAGAYKPWTQIGQLCTGKWLRYPKMVETSKASSFEDPLENKMLHLKGLILPINKLN